MMIMMMMTTIYLPKDGHPSRQLLGPMYLRWSKPTHYEYAMLPLEVVWWGKFPAKQNNEINCIYKSDKKCVTVHSTEVRVLYFASYCACLCV